ncbi:hypothetical protein [Dysgonomonas macrotermitis]|uniref:Conjugal transfer protein TraD n=1 Tax=Dysgonomonas macrotermitis TaxID=1346286 RepID=A0A1M5JR27_9BACT|nr:hypothetical protein [Dysgonomonas macrotermitis]SHG43011.1 hypothetical protein SAMN05444362_12718 [Dysgonomonas macrotermitis]
MIQIIIVAASIVLGMILYPILLKQIDRFVNWWYWHMRASPVEKEISKKSKPEPEPSKIPSVIGESKTKLGHDRTNATTNPKNDGVIEKESTFAPETKEETNQIADVDVPLAKVETLPEEEFDPDEEAVELEAERGAVLASGAGYDELMATGNVIANKHPSDEEKDEAGRVLYENEATEMVEQIVSQDEKTFAKVNDLISFHMKKHNLTGEDSNMPDPEEFENFDINSIF